MVVCKYFQQGTCRYGQYCRFQHINNFGGNQNTTKQFAEGKNIVLEVAEEVLAAERGGQWLLSCFGPFKEQPCIPGMDDVSPEEVRWEMYQAQKNGTVEQMKLQYQQLCQAMSAKREALKNPTHETAAMLEKLQKTNSRDNTFGGKGNFALSSSQLGQSPNTGGVFGTKSFSTASNPFGGGFNTATSGSSSIFGRTSTNNTSVFGAKPTFGASSVFGSQTSTSSVFGGTQSNMPTFATATSPSNSVFGGGASGQAPSVFAQQTTFGATSEAISPFSMSQNAQTTNSVFGTATTASNSPFGTPSLFGGSTSTPSIFGGSATSSNSIFGGATGTPSSTTIGSTSIFAQTKSSSAVAFGGAPVFASTTGGFPTTQPAFPAFGAQPTFENAALPSTNVFGNASTQSTTFGSSAQSTNSFAALATSAPFGAAAATTTATPFGTSTGPFGTSANSSPFAARNPTFGNILQPGNETFSGAVATLGESPFASAATGGTFGPTPVSNAQPFGTPAFGNAPSTPFACTTSTATTSNPFAPRPNQPVNTPFGVANTTMSSGGPFGQTNFATVTTPSIIDETAYTPEGKLTDDEKSFYIAEQFVLGKIPLKPPTIELR